MGTRYAIPLSETLAGMIFMITALRSGQLTWHNILSILIIYPLFLLFFHLCKGILKLCTRVQDSPRGPPKLMTLRIIILIIRDLYDFKKSTVNEYISIEDYWNDYFSDFPELFRHLLYTHRYCSKVLIFFFS